MDYGNESDDEPMSTEMLEDIRYGSQYQPNVNRREAHYKIRDCIIQRQSEWKGALKATRKWVKFHTRCLRLSQKKFRNIYQLWVNLAQKFPILFQNPETFMKLPKC